MLLNIDIINFKLSKYISYKHLFYLYMSCKYIYNNKLNNIELENIYYTPKNNIELKEAVKYYLSKYKNNLNIDIKYNINHKNINNINRWNTKYITNMCNLFQSNEMFNENINDWIVSNVTDMSSMFYRCLSFNQYLNDWNTSNVIHMKGMFSYAIDFNQELNNWNTSKVK